jgi:hypothetical protein
LGLVDGGIAVLSRTPVSRRLVPLVLVTICSLLGLLSIGGAPALAAAPEAPETTAPVEVSNSTAVLAGFMSPHSRSTAGWYFNYKPGAAGCDGGSTTPLQPEEEFEDREVQAQVAGLQPGTQYTACLIARNAEGETTPGAPVTFSTTALAPSIDDQFITEGGETSVLLNASVASHGTPGSYHFDYGTSSSYGSTTPVKGFVALHADTRVTAQLTGLLPNTTYHARVVAESTLGAITGADFTFSTLPPSNGLLPDGRAYELVTPLDNDDADIYAPEIPFTGQSENDTSSSDPFQASLDGSAVTYAADPVPGGNGSGGQSENSGNQLLATRTANGWSQEVVAATGRNHSFYETFSADLSIGILRAGNGYQETTALLPEADALNGGYHVLYERHNSTGVERALFTGFTASESPGPYEFQPAFVGGTADLSTQVFDANAALVAGAPTGHNVYESTLGKLSIVNVLPDGSLEPDAQAGSPEEEGGEGNGAPELSHAVSADGSRIFWTGLGAHPGLYMREDGSTTVQLDVSQAGGSGGGGHFWTASSDGERVFFTDDAAAGLTSDTVPGSGLNLYEYDVDGHVLTDLTASADARVQGVIGASEDGSYVYFVADGALAPGSRTGECSPFHYYNDTNECDLYVRHDGVTSLVSSLSELDGLDTRPFTRGDGAHGDWAQGLGSRSAEVSANGAAVFTSMLSLTGYRNKEDPEVYVYEPGVGVGHGELSCASCDPTGAPPSVSGTEGSEYRGGSAGTLPVSNDRSQATRWISADGSRVFFDSMLGLLPQDTNERLDVYEWERDGSGNCTNAGGCLSLLSGGKSSDNSYLMDASLSGDDVFLVTRAQLLEADRNENFDVYDVRVDGVTPPPTTSCSGAGCQGVPPVPPIFATPASVTFEGVGNFPVPAKSTTKAKSKPKRVKALTRAQKLSKALATCRRQAKRKRAACERAARRRYTTKSTAKRSAKGGK